MPWRRLAWVTWRQHRAALARDAPGFALTRPCCSRDRHPAPRGCAPGTGRSGARSLVAVLQLALLRLRSACSRPYPLLAGMFLGAPLLAARPRPAPTRLAWTQGVSRTRWLLARSCPLAVLLAVAAAGLGLELQLVARAAGPESPGYPSVSVGTPSSSTCTRCRSPAGSTLGFTPRRAPRRRDPADRARDGGDARLLRALAGGDGRCPGGLPISRRCTARRRSRSPLGWRVRLRRRAAPSGPVPTSSAPHLAGRTGGLLSQRAARSPGGLVHGCTTSGSG